MTKTTESSFSVAAAAVASTKAVVDAAIATAKVLEASNTSLAIMGTNIDFIKKDIIEIKISLKDLSLIYVSRNEFQPVQKIVYGMVSVILLAVVGALVTLVVSK